MIKKIKEIVLNLRTFFKTKAQIQQQILELSRFETRRTRKLKQDIEDWRNRYFADIRKLYRELFLTEDDLKSKKALLKEMKKMIEEESRRMKK